MHGAKQIAAGLCIALASVTASSSDKLAVPPAAQINIPAGQHKLFRSFATIHRTAIADPAICDVNVFNPSELALVGRARGQTEVTFWFSNPALPPQTFTVEVK